MAFVKGQSGNPGGRPKDVAQVKELARAYTLEAVERLVFWLRSENPKASTASAIALLERGWGKPEQKLEGEFVTTYVVRTPAVAGTVPEWQNQHTPAGLKPTIQ